MQPSQSLSGHGRMPLLDVIKGVACLIIVAHHFALYGPMSQGAEVLAPALFDWLAQHGRLAVQVFLVVGGFLAAASLAPDGELRAGRPAARIVQRYRRLVLPYLLALSVCVAVSAWARPWLDSELVPAAPTWPQLLAHALLLHDLLELPALSAGVWYVAVDFQLFTLALGVLLLADRLRAQAPNAPWMPPHARPWVGVAGVLGVTLASLAYFNRDPEMDDTALYFFGAYGLGMLSHWSSQSRRRSTWWAAAVTLALIGGLALLIDWRSRIALALLTALALLVLQRGPGLAWLPPCGGRLLAAVGRISYSLFLIHFPVLLLVSAWDVRWAAPGPWSDLLGLSVAFALSVELATAMHRHIESRRSARGLGWGLAVLFLGAGALAGA